MPRTFHRRGLAWIANQLRLSRDQEILGGGTVTHDLHSVPLNSGPSWFPELTLPPSNVVGSPVLWLGSMHSRSRPSAHSRFTRRSSANKLRKAPSTSATAVSDLLLQQPPFCNAFQGVLCFGMFNQVGQYLIGNRSTRSFHVELVSIGYANDS